MCDLNSAFFRILGTSRSRVTGGLSFLLSVPRASGSQPAPGRPSRVCSLKHVAAVSVAIGMLSVNLTAPLLASEEVIIQGRPRVVDGDTFVFQSSGQKQRVRLKALDAFELSQLCFDSSRGGDYKCGVVARGEMVRIIGDREIMCRGKGNDIFGRLVASCYIADTGADVGEKLVRSGWALAFRQYGKDYAAAEDVARVHHSGAWAGQFTNPWTARQIKREAASEKK